LSDIYRNSTQFVYLDIYGGVADAPPTAVCVDEAGTTTDLTVQGPETTTDNAQRWTATIPLTLTQNVGELTVNWNFALDGVTATKTDYFDVIVPLADLATLRDELELGEEVTDAQLARAERKVRNFIENFCGQAFVPTDETVTLKWDGENIMLPKRLISFTSSNPVLAVVPVIKGDGFVLNIPELTPDGYPIVDPSYGDTYPTDSSGIIIPPYLSRTGYYKQYKQITITGHWGWDRVPNNIQEAAFILVNDYLSPDQLYRDKYLTSLTSPDWRIQFHGSAFRRTGNARVDALLEDYVVKHLWRLI